MECLVFGDPITEETLKRNPEYANKELTSTDIAQIALNMKNTGGKNIAALNHAKSLKNKLGIDIGVVTFGVLYNATGKTLTYVTSHDYDGIRGTSPNCPYPKTLENGQWAVFVHKSTSGSSAAVAYRGQFLAKKGCAWIPVFRDWVMAWDIPALTRNNGLNDEKAYTEVREPAPYDQKRWDEIAYALSMSGSTSSDEYDGCYSYVSMGDDGLFEGMMSCGLNKS